MSELTHKLAKIFDVDISDIFLKDVRGGLSHQCYSAKVAKESFFVKDYSGSTDHADVISGINQLTAYMCKRGVPASRLVRHSASFPEIVVHEFVDASMCSGETSQLAAIAGLYSQLAQIGLERCQWLNTAQYLSGLQLVIEQINAMCRASVTLDDQLHAGMCNLAEDVFELLNKSGLAARLLHIQIHDDFTEKNILMADDQVRLLCDWDSFRLKMFAEHLACAATRFSTTRPLTGVLEKPRLSVFLRSISPQLLQQNSLTEGFSELFPVLATLKHLRTYEFRNRIVFQHNQPKLKTSLLEWPLQHCRWLLQHRQQVSSWVEEILSANSGQ